MNRRFAYLAQIQALALGGTVTLLSGCTESGAPQPVGALQQKTGPTGGNNIGPYGVDARPLKPDVTDSYGLTSPGNPDPLPLKLPLKLLPPLLNVTAFP